MIKMIFGALVATLGILSSASANPFVSCRQELPGNSYRIVQFYLFGTTGSDVSTAKGVEVFFSPVGKVPQAGQPLASITYSSTSSSQAAIRQPVIFPVVSVRKTETAVALTLAGGGDLLIEHNPSARIDSPYKVYYVRPIGPEVPKVFEHCEILIRQIGSTVSNVR